MKDGVILLRTLLEELRRNMEGERDGIMATYAKLIDALKKQNDLLLKDLERYVVINYLSPIDICLFT